MSSRRVETSRQRWTRRTAVGAAPVVLATLAILHPGAAVSQVDLNDGAVWLTNTSELKVGRYNVAVEELNAGLVTSSATFDVLQDGMDVLLVEPEQIAVIDPAGVTLGAQTTIPYGSDVSMAGGTTAVTLPSDGTVFAKPTQAIGMLDVVTGEPDLELGEGGAAVVARSGLVLAVGPDGTVHKLDVGDDGSVDHDAGRVEGELSGAIEQITAVGDEVVVLAGQTLHTTSGSVDLAGYGGQLVLQQAGPRADVVLVATTTALLEVPLDGGEPREHVSGSSGTPAAPVFVAGCAHAAWAAPVANYMVVCGGSEPEIGDLTEVASSDVLVFRVNRSLVVLNDTSDGRLWLVTEDPEVREPNWEDIQKENETEDVEDPERTTVTTQTLQAECTAQSAAPTAENDEFGTRESQTVILPVIDNDASSSCGVLVINEFDQIPEDFGTLVPVYGGRAFQLTTSDVASGSVEFTYTVTDGRGSVAPSTATVRVNVVPEGENSAPVQVRAGAMVVEQGGAGTYDVLADFRDPDGDQMVLVGAVAVGGGTARSRGDGQVRFQSDGSTLGRQTINVQVSDGVETILGELYVDVRPAGSVLPVIDPVHVVTYADEPVVVHPLDAVRTESREPVELAGVDEVAGLTIEPDLEAGTFTVTSRTAGTYYVPFTVVAMPQQATGLARIDVLERPEAVVPPVAVLDVALLPPGGEVTIDPLANDSDSSGAVLVVQSVDVPADSGLQVAILDHQLLRITSTRTLEAPVFLEYTVSNGIASAVGEVRVQPVPASASRQAPVVPDVEATVRTGGVVTIAVLEDAYDPDGDELTLSRELIDAPASGQGLMFVSGDVLRYQAPDQPTDVRATFTVTDPMGNATAGTVTVTVHASDAEDKALPRPLPLTARVYEGETVEIPVPLTGIDPDGDGVLLLGPDQVPGKGIVTVGDADELVYRALPGETGTDTFTYAVEDWTGRRAVGTVRVGIVPRPSSAAEVICRDDTVAVRPGRSVDVLVLANDVDAGGGDLTLDETLGPDPAVPAVVDGDRIVVTTTEPGLLQILYTARNARGGQDTAMLTVEVSDDAPILPPIAQDVVVPAIETLNMTSVDVDVLAVAQNPSGPLSDLEVMVDPSVADVAVVTRDDEVRVTLVDHAQTLPYYLRNTDPAAEGLSSYAFITVPALGDFPPLLRPGAEELSVIAGETLEIRLEEQVQVAPGRTAVVEDPTTVSATKASAYGLVGGDETLSYTAAEGYAGAASISALVSDGPLGDPTTHSRMLTLPITVLAAEQYPPTFTPSVLDVAPGDVSRVDLAVFTSAPVATVDGAGQYTFDLVGDPPTGFEVSLTGSILSVKPGDTIPRGTVAGIPIEIEYGGAEPLAAQVDVRVVASSRPLARVQGFTVPDGVEGQPSTVSVLAGAFNPYPDTPLTVLDAVVETPDSGTADVSGSDVTVRPNEGFIGQMVTRFTVRDATGDPDRVVEGRITVTVRGAPEAPTTPRVGEPGDGQLRLEWDAPANNGEPIDSYRVTAVQGGIAQNCPSTTCVVTGLTNNSTYRFTVAAHNAVGWSEESPVSGDGRPDVLPGKPSPPTVTRRDGALDVSWAAPANRGSPITGYDVVIAPASPNGGVLSTHGALTSMRIEGLVNGREYRVQVCAKNLASEQAGECSDASTGVPAGVPGAPPGVQAVSHNPGLLASGTIVVSWGEAFANGAEINRYEVWVNGSVVQMLPSDRSYTFDAERGVRYDVRVRASNSEGAGAWADTSGRVWSAPGLPGNLSAQDVGGQHAWGQGQLRLSWSAPSDTGGSGITIHHYEVDGFGNVGSGSSYTVGGLTGGQAYTFRVRAVNSEGAAGEWASFPAAVPITAPDAPSVSLDTTTIGQVVASWSIGANGGTSDGLAYRYRLDSHSAWTEVGTGTTATFTVNPGSRFHIEVQVGNSRGWSYSTVQDVDTPSDP
jgi:hypothetical protein